MNIELVYVSQSQSWVVPMTVDHGCSVRQAILSSGILQSCPEINLAVNKVGIYSRITSLDTLLEAEDRIEIYRPLLIDPKEARRLRADKNR